MNWKNMTQENYGLTAQPSSPLAGPASDRSGVSGVSAAAQPVAHRSWVIACSVLVATNQHLATRGSTKRGTRPTESPFDIAERDNGFEPSTSSLGM